MMTTIKLLAADNMGTELEKVRLVNVYHKDLMDATNIQIDGKWWVFNGMQGMMVCFAEAKMVNLDVDGTWEYINAK